MIYTVTFNPSLDYIIRLDEFIPGTVNRTRQEQMLGGGKGINVSIVLQNLGVPSTALGFIAGFTGAEIVRQLKSFGCTEDFIYLPEGNSRINVKIRGTEETEVNGQGPVISAEAINKLFAKLDRLTEGDILVLAGSIPHTLPDDMYEQILRHLEGRQIRIVVDATGSLLTKVLKYHPFLIKPNNHELEEIFQVTLHSQEDICQYGQRLQTMGARNVLISMAGDGAILLTEKGQRFFSLPPQGELVNSVGAGDSMVAGFIAGLVKSGGNYEDAFYTGVAAGSASAFSPNLATAPEVEALLKKLRVN